MNAPGTEKHQLRFARVDWRRIGELAEREGVSRSELLRRCFALYEQSNAREPLPLQARARPLSTGEMILAYLVIANGSETEARLSMRASPIEWSEAIGSIPGLRVEIDRRWSNGHG